MNNCCQRTEDSTPVSTANRPGLAALHTRIGTHGTFLATMKARLTRQALLGLQTREASDPSIALLDAWATVADVLTFYQERIANEGYLRTATERQSVLELARLVGYQLRPGVAASVYLAFTMDNDAVGEIPAETRVQSLPGPGELPQTFETSEHISARANWNDLRLRATRPQLMTKEIVELKRHLYLKGTHTGLQVNAPLLIDYTGKNDADDMELYRVTKVTPEQVEGRTKVTFEPWVTQPATEDLETVIEQLKPLVEATPNQFNVMPDPSFTTFLETAKWQAVEMDQLGNDLQEAVDKLYEAQDQRQQYIDDLNELLASQDEEGLRIAQKRTARELEAARQRLTRIQALHRAAKRAEKPLFKKLLEEQRQIVNNLVDTGIDGLYEVTSVDLVEEIKRLDTVVIPSAKENIARLKQLYQDAIGRCFEQWKVVKTLLEAIGYEKFNFENWTDYNLQSPMTTSLRALRMEDTFPLPTPNWALGNTIHQIHIRPSMQPRSAVDLRMEQKTLFQRTNNIVPKMIAVQYGLEGQQVYDALAGTSNPDISEAKVYVFRVKAALFGHNALKPSDVGATPSEDPTTHDWNRSNESAGVLWLDSVYDKVTVKTPIVIVRANDYATTKPFTTVKEVQEASRSDYKLSGKCTRIMLSSSKPWPDTVTFSDIRITTVYAQAEALELAEMPVLNAVTPQQIELNTVADGLESGNWVIVSGERTDMGDVTGVQGAELAMLASVEHCHDDQLPGDRTVTHLIFDTPLEYRFKPSTVVVYGNVVNATHGETRTEVLGSGNGSQALQSFALQQKPLTYLAAITPRGVESTLEVRVNDLEWHETDNIAAQSPIDRVFATITDDADKTTIQFGDGEHGARLPTGLENVRAKYRIGIGKAGNVGAGRITVLSTRPVGVKSVTNPIRASGGVNKETRDQARKNTSLATRALGRIVSVSDYADFARTFAGIGKSHAVRLIDGTQTLVYLTIAGAEDAPIDRTSDLYRNLVAALRRYGDPYQAVQVDLRDLLTLVISARVQILPDYEWESVKPKIESRLLDQFGFERRELGQHVTASEVISVIQRIPGVAYVDLDILDSLSKEQVNVLASTPERNFGLLPSDLMLRTRIIAHLPEINRLDIQGEIAPAQIIYLRPDLKETLVLNRITTP